MVQQPKATTTATSTAPLTRDDTPWPNTMPAYTNLFIARASWPISPYMDEVPTPTFVKTEKTEEMTPPRQTALPHTLILNKSQNNKPAEEKCKWGPKCPMCTQPNPNTKTEDTEEDRNSDRQRNRKEDQSKRNYDPQVQSTPHPMIFQIDCHTITKCRKTVMKGWSY